MTQTVNRPIKSTLQKSNIPPMKPWRVKALTSVAMLSGVATILGGGSLYAQNKIDSVECVPEAIDSPAKQEFCDVRSEKRQVSKNIIRFGVDGLVVSGGLAGVDYLQRRSRKGITR